MNIFNKDFKKRFNLLNNSFKEIGKKKGIDDNTQRLISTIKLSEECGELSEAVLLDLGWQRQSKLDKYKKEDLEDEIADVLIQTMVIADLSHVDIEKAVLNKLEKLEEKLSQY